MTKNGTEIKKIAVLGGGMSALTAVYELKQPDWQAHYDITVYQMGWRLGGKGASGRDPENGDRIEEHGLHLWFGCYHNAFNLLRSAYEENARPLGQPLSSLKEAFEPARFVVLNEEVNGEMLSWPLEFPFTSDEPGGEVEILDVWENVSAMLRIMIERFLEAQINTVFRPQAQRSAEEMAFYKALNSSFLEQIKQYTHLLGSKMTGMDLFEGMEFVEKFLANCRRFGNYDLLLFGLEEMRKWFWGEVKDHLYQYPDVRRLWILFDLTAATIQGVVRDKLISKGLDAINHLDFREWISRYCMTPEMTAWSAPIQAMYGLIFCGKNQSTFEAGTCLRCIFRVALNYKGAFYYRMNAGMGDVVFTPIYEVLKKRGVKFRFFHKITQLRLSADKRSIQAIDVARQVTLKNGDYAPLYEVKGLACWPSHPLYEQLVEGEALRQGKVNLESAWADWQDAELFSLERGRDFDEVLMGISIGAIPSLCKELLAASEAWRNMVRHVETTPTQALQLWFRPDIAGLGWRHAMHGKPMVGNFPGALDTWVDLSNLLIRENWPASHTPAHISYLCGRFEYPGIADVEERDFPEIQRQKVHAAAIEFLERHSRHLWPDPVREDDAFNWDLLVDLQDRGGPERLEGQYYRVNVDPTERYVLAVTGNSRHRLKAGKSGFDNLVITGDWIDNGFNAGCIEASVIAGMQAARAISGLALHIIGEFDKKAARPLVRVNGR